MARRSREELQAETARLQAELGAKRGADSAEREASGRWRGDVREAARGTVEDLVLAAVGLVVVGGCAGAGWAVTGTPAGAAVGAGAGVVLVLVVLVLLAVTGLSSIPARRRTRAR